METRRLLVIYWTLIGHYLKFRHSEICYSRYSTAYITIDGMRGTAAISGLAEKPETFFRSFLVVAFAEALAIYGLIVAILLWISL
jgi:hypothetical protein